MAFPLFFLLIGAFFLFHNNGWTLNFDFGIGTLWPILSMLFGLVLMLKRRD